MVTRSGRHSLLTVTLRSASAQTLARRRPGLQGLTIATGAVKAVARTRIQVF